MFGLNFTTTERDLEREFGRFGKLEKVQVVLDGPTKRSRGFAFIYFERIEDAEKAREAMNGTEISGFKIRVDFSITSAAHRPTPGVYFHHGKATRPGFRLGGRGGRGGRGGGRYEYRDRYHERDRYDDRDKYYERRPPPSHYDRGKNERDYNCWSLMTVCQVTRETVSTTGPVTVMTGITTTTATPGRGRGSATTRTGTGTTATGRTGTERTDTESRTGEHWT